MGSDPRSPLQAQTVPPNDGSVAASNSGNAVVPPPQRVQWRGFKRWVFVGALLLGAMFLTRAWWRGGRVDAHVYSAEELKSGPISQIVEWPDGRHTAVQISRLTDLPADHLWRVVTDQGRFDEFMPYVQKTTVRPGPDGSIRERQVLNLPHADYELELEIRIRDSGNRRSADWRQVKGVLPFNEGSWIVEKVNERSILRYQVSTSLGWVPQFAVNYALRPRLHRLLEAVEKRTRELQEHEPDYFLPRSVGIEESRE